MEKKRTYFGLTTVQQRKLLFRTWEETGSVTQACQKARVSRGTFYYWKQRFDEHGYAGLQEFESRRPHRLRTKDEATRQRVIAMRQEHPDWGKLRISHELAQDNNWVPVVSPNGVRRILRDAGLWPEGDPGGKRPPKR